MDEFIRGAPRGENYDHRSGEWLGSVQAPATCAPDETNEPAPVYANARRGLNFRSAGELIANPKPIAWLVRERLEQNCLGLVFGDPGTGKSFVALDWAASIATGTPWFDHKVAAGPVFYIAGEGGNGLTRRLCAWERHKGISLSIAPLFVSTVAAALTDEEAFAFALTRIREMIAQHGTPMLIVLDTLARNFGPGDENNTQDMTAFVTACDRLREEAGSTVLVIHHSGHGDKMRARGSIVMKAALDWEHRLTVDDHGVVTMECTKAKDADEPRPLSFRLTTIPLGITDDEGAEVTSAVLTPAQHVPRPKKGKEGRGRNQTLALRVLQEALREFDQRPDRDGTNGELWVSRAAWRDRCERDGLEARAFNDVVRTLAAQEKIRIVGDRVTYDEFA